MTRRSLGIVLAGAALTVSVTAQAQDYPERPITMIIMSSEGGGMDRASRLVGDAMAERLGQPMRYVNRPGASGEIALRSFMATEDDGYTIFSGNIPTLILGYGSEEQDYVFEDEVAWLGAYLNDPAILATAAGSAYQSAGDLIADATSRPIRVGVANWSSVQTLALLQLAAETGAEFEIIPFSGFRNAATAMLGEDIEAAVGNFSAIERLGEEARGLGIFAPGSPNGAYEPLADNLDVPIFAAASNRALAVHESLKSSHPDRYEALSSAYADVVSDPAFAESFSTIGASPTQLIAWGEEEAEAAAADILAVLEEYRELFDQGG
ncbi:MAG: tripartite tricarboxylate transporter substrate-binding protein [Pseudomonadota bacterium]